MKVESVIKEATKFASLKVETGDLVKFPSGRIGLILESYRTPEPDPNDVVAAIVGNVATVGNVGDVIHRHTLESLLQDHGRLDRSTLFIGSVELITKT